MNPIRIAVPATTMVVDNYVRAIEAQGAVPLVKHSIEELDVNEFDALLLPGGGDINPARYGQEPDGCGTLEDALDDLQFAFIDAAVKAGKPILGICRGCQLTNVYFGGTLIQDIATSKKHARDNLLTGPDKHHDAIVTGTDSYLYPIYGEKFRINSSHHQVLDRLGEGIIVDLYSTDEDHLIEAAHHKTLPIWMTQWHPERCRPTDEQPDEVDGYKVFEFFISKIRSLNA